MESTKKDSDASKDSSFKKYPTLEGCTYHLEKNKNVVYDNVTYVTLEIFIDGVNEPIILNKLTITTLKRW